MGIGGPQFHARTALVKAFNRRLTVNNRYDGITIIGDSLLLHNNQIPIPNAVVDHGVSPHLHDEVCAGTQQHRRHQHRLVIFKDLDGLASHHPTHQGNFQQWFQGGKVVCRLQGAGLVPQAQTKLGSSLYGLGVEG